jgi:uncharacterized cupredoxin-like copper-binding protein
MSMAARARTIAALLALSAAGGCTSAPSREIPIAMSNYAFTPSLVELRRGERVRWVLHNTTTIDHEFGSSDALFEEVTVPPQKTRAVAWTAPARAGTYRFICALEGHRGMIMHVEVK